MIKYLISISAALSVSAATAQLIAVPAPQAQTRTAWRCLAQIDAGGATIHAFRELDAKGHFLTDGASWVELPSEQTASNVEVSLVWPSDHGGRLKFGRGKLSFVVIGASPQVQPDEFRMVGPLSGNLGSFAAGRASSRENAVESVIRLSDWKGIAGKDRAFMWSFLAKHKALVGNVYFNANLLDVEARFPALISSLDTLAKDFTKACTPVTSG